MPAFSGDLVNVGRMHYQAIPSICQRLENAPNCFLSHYPAAVYSPQQRQPARVRIFKADRTKARKKRGGLRYRALL